MIHVSYYISFFCVTITAANAGSKGDTPAADAGLAVVAKDFTSNSVAVQQQYSVRSTSCCFYRTNSTSNKQDYCFIHETI